MNKIKRKELKTSLYGKGAASPDAGQLGKINNGYALEPLEAEQVYARRMYLCNNAVDRDGERFGEETLGTLAATLPGKGVLDWHPQSKGGDRGIDDIIGRFYAAEIVTESLAAAKSRTGEDLILPDGVTEVKWVVGSFYIPLLTQELKDIAAKIDAGLLPFVSIGFEWKSPTKICSEEDPDTVLYWEYQTPLEAHEGSLVWLGAQPGAQVTKSINGNPEESGEQPKEKEMKGLKTFLGLNDDASENSVMEAVKGLKEKAATALAALKSLGIETVAEAEALKVYAEAGKTYQQTLVERIVGAEGKMGRFADDAAKEARGKSLSGGTIAQLLSDAEFIEKQVNEKFPTEPKTASGTTGSREEGDDTKSLHAIITGHAKSDGITYTAAYGKYASRYPGAVKAAATKATFN